MRLNVALNGRGYAVVLKRGALARVNQLAALNRRVLVVTDAGVPARAVKTLLGQCGQGFVEALPAGEAAKTPEGWRQVARRLQAEGFARGDAVAALGGGAVCGVAGFAAATYLGGIDCLMLPTTTCAQADAALGGRACLNQGGVKDVLSLTRQPALVVADPDLLATLPPRHFAGGLATVLKLGLAESPELLAALEGGTEGGNLERLLYLALEAKKDLIERDEAGMGESRRLGFGRLLGSAIEAAGGFERYTYGEALALGMLPMIESRTLQRRARGVMRALGLPLKHGFTAAQLMPYLERDPARREDGRTEVVRVKTAGQGYVELLDAEELRLLVEGACGA